MVKKFTGQLKRWSFSAWAQAKRCGLAVYLSYIDKGKDASHESYSMLRGQEVHLKAEYFIKGEVRGIPPILSRIRNELAALKKAKPIVEEYWNFDPQFKPVGEYQGTLVVKSDAAVPPGKNCAINIDYKTGNEYSDHKFQASLSAVATKAKFPKTDGVVFEFWYVDSGVIRQFEYNERKLKVEKAFWIEEGRKLMAMRRFYPEPSEDACRFCFHRSDKGGRCNEWRKV